MGHRTEAVCRDCGKAFTIDHGGGFHFHLLRCDACGKTKSIGFDEIGELHQRYLKELQGPYCVASAEHDAEVRKNAEIKPISEKEYHKGVEAIAGRCACGANFTFDAPPRCPKCRSTKIEEGEITIFYD